MSELKEYDEFYIIGGIDYPQSKLSRFHKRKGVFPNDKDQINWQQTGRSLTCVLAILKAHQEYDIPIKELAFDPCELSLNLFHNSVKPVKNHQLYHGYDIEKYNMKRVDSLQYFQQYNRVSSYIEVDKKFDFCFGYTVFKGSGREKYVNYVDELARRSRSKIFVENHQTEENTLVPFNEYYQFIKKSRFTLILPAYDKNSFSIYRFLESIEADCLPLIHPDCNIDDVNKSFGVDLSNLKTSEFFSEDERIRILSKLKSKLLFMSKINTDEFEIVTENIDTDSLKSADSTVNIETSEVISEPIYLKKVKERTLNKLEKVKENRKQAVFEKEIQASWNKSIEGILEVGMLFSIAKATLDKSSYAKLFEKFTFSQRTADRLIYIQNSEYIQTHMSQMPSSWSTLYEIAVLEKKDEKTFKKALEDNVINPSVQRKVVNNLIPKKTSVKKAKTVKVEESSSCDHDKATNKAPSEASDTESRTESGTEPERSETKSETKTVNVEESTPYNNCMDLLDGVDLDETFKNVPGAPSDTKSETKSGIKLERSDDWKDHWVDMPDFEQEKNDPFKEITVRFKTKEDYEAYAKLVNQNLTEKTKSIWYPKLERDKNSLKRWMSNE